MNPGSVRPMFIAPMSCAPSKRKVIGKGVIQLWPAPSKRKGTFLDFCYIHLEGSGVLLVFPASDKFKLLNVEVWLQS
jgi:hypothetical protein